MSNPISHHWLPQFLMSPWCGTDGKVTRFYRPHDRVVSSRKSPKGIGAVDHLYTINWKLIADPFLLEKNIMSNALDGPFSKVRDKMISGRIPTDAAERRSVCQFLMMMFARHPDFIIGKRDGTARKVFEIFKKIPITIDGATYLMSEEEVADLYAQTYQGYEDYLIISTNIEAAISSEVVHEIMQLEWKIIDISNIGFTFVLGDNPVQIFQRAGSLEWVEFPLSPHHLFLAGTTEYFHKEPIFRKEFLNMLALRVSRRQFEKVTDFAIATDCGPNDCYLKIAEDAMPPRTSAASR